MATVERAGSIGNAEGSSLGAVGRSTAGLPRASVRWLSADRPVAGWVLAASGLLPLLLIAGWLLGDALQPTSYSPVRQSVSVLAGHAGTDRWVVTGVLFVIGACYLVTAVGLAAVGLPARIGLLVAGLAGIGIALCPEPVHGSTPQHLLFTTIGAITLSVWPALVPRRAAGPLPLRRGTIVAVTAVFLALLAWTFAETRDGAALGLAERASCSIEVCWPFVVASALRRTNQLPSRPRSPGHASGVYRSRAS